MTAELLTGRCLEARRGRTCRRAGQCLSFAGAVDRATASKKASRPAFGLLSLDIRRVCSDRSCRASHVHDAAFAEAGIIRIPTGDAGRRVDHLSGAVLLPCRHLRRRTARRSSSWPRRDGRLMPAHPSNRCVSDTITRKVNRRWPTPQPVRGCALLSYQLGSLLSSDFTSFTLTCGAMVGA